MDSPAQQVDEILETAGLSIVRERMGGQVSAQITGDILEIKLSFRGA